MNEISNYLTDVYQDWQDSRDAFPKNVYLKRYWPIPFFGNPRTALVATVGVNPSSDEFSTERNWAGVTDARNWEHRLEDYFTGGMPAHGWFGPWREGLKLLECSYEKGTAVHFDVSYRPTKAMLKNETTDRREFRHMAERDVAWLFRLLPLCQNLRGLLAYGPIVRHNRSTEALAAFIRKSAPRHGFVVLSDGGLRNKVQASREVFLHEVNSAGAGTVTEKVVADLTRFRDHLCAKIHPSA